MRHHDETLRRYVAAARADRECVGVIVVGSVARGTERADSDVDVYRVVTAEAYEAALASGAVAHVDRKSVTYSGGYVDVKLCDEGYLVAAAERGDDPTRASFEGARVAFERARSLAPLISAIAHPPSEHWTGRVAGFQAQAHLHGGYFYRQAHDHADAFGQVWAAAHLAHAVGRLALAKHLTLYRGAKYLTDMVGSLDLPGGLLDAWRAVITAPSPERVTDLLERVDAWVGPMSVGDSLSRFIVDNELAWLQGTIPPEYS